MSAYRRRRKISLEEGIVFLIVAFVLATVSEKMRSLIISAWYVYAIMLAVIIGTLGIRVYHLRRLSKAGIKEIDAMSGTDFERFLAGFFSKLGYHVEHTGHIADLGVDLILKKDGKRIALQAKRYQGNVGPDAVREVVTVLKPRNCESGMVVTNSYYTEEAKMLARANDIVLWNRNDLVNTILKFKSE